MRLQPFDIVIKEGVEYAAGRKWGMVVRAIGTDSSGKGHLVIDDAAMGDINSLVAPMHRTSDNLLGPLKLGELTYVIPPDSVFRWAGDSGSKCRLIGEYVFLAPGETFPTDLLERYHAQANHYRTFVEASTSLDVDASLPADQEVEVLTLTPTAVETYVLDGPVMVDVENYTPSEGDLALRFKYDEAYLDTLLEKTKTGGIDVLSCPRRSRGPDGGELWWRSYRALSPASTPSS